VARYGALVRRANRQMGDAQISIIAVFVAVMGLLVNNVLQQTLLLSRERLTRQPLIIKDSLSL
jgi:hypothetical protein